ncbi:MAG: Gfo/Idh/MocA family oxidoreductase [Acidobacteriota bacterium]|nr:Gfo/Idh/MocA family oxidoreductase [Acidobacteriota bacterium]
MKLDALDRRSFLKAVGTTGMMSAFPAAALAAPGSGQEITHEVAAPSPEASQPPKYSINFAVCGMSHDHIYGMVGAIIRGGGKLVAFYGEEPEKLARFAKQFPNVKQVRSEDEILNDPSIQLVLSSTIASHRAPLGVRVMRHGKDYLSDKPGITTLEQLAAVRKTIAETGRIYGIMYSERLEVKGAVKAGELVHAGAIGRVIQTINIAPHQVSQPVRAGQEHNGGADARPAWFWEPELYGGILCDIGSHQVDQFLYYTGCKQAEVVASQIANIRHPEHPKFQDFGDMMLRGDRGFGYVRLDWFTPDALGTWGDGRLFILGTEGYIEVRKYTNVGVSHSGNNLFLVNKTEQRYIDCNQVYLPFGPQFVSDIVNRTHTAQDQEQCLLAAELVITAQKQATLVHLAD